MTRGSYTTPVNLRKDHRVDDFECTHPELNEWLRTHARSSHGGGFTRVVVTTQHGSDDVIGFYAIAPGSVQADQATTRMSVGGGRHPVPVIVLVRLAVHGDHAGQGIGSALLRDAIIRALASAEEIGGRALVVHCKDDTAKAFYLKQIPEFEELPDRPMHLVLLLKDVRATING